MKRNHEIVAMWINEKSVESYTINMSLSFKLYTQHEKGFFISCPDIDGQPEFFLKAIISS